MSSSIVDLKLVVSGDLNGTRVWVCQYNQPDLDKKPLRNVPPTEMVIVSNDELPPNKTIYYSGSHLRPLNKKGEPTSRIVPVFDNTGFRGRTGTPLHILTNREACIAQWNADLEAVGTRIEARVQNAMQTWKDRLSTHKELYVNE